MGYERCSCSCCCCYNNIQSYNIVTSLCLFLDFNTDSFGFGFCIWDHSWIISFHSMFVFVFLVLTKSYPNNGKKSFNFQMQFPIINFINNKNSRKKYSFFFLKIFLFLYLFMKLKTFSIINVTCNL